MRELRWRCPGGGSPRPLLLLCRSARCERRLLPVCGIGSGRLRHLRRQECLQGHRLGGRGFILPGCCLLSQCYLVAAGASVEIGLFGFMGTA